MNRATKIIFMLGSFYFSFRKSGKQGISWCASPHKTTCLGLKIKESLYYFDFAD
jgi:hypothetical protein